MKINQELIEAITSQVIEQMQGAKGPDSISNEGKDVHQKDSTKPELKEHMAKNGINSKEVVIGIGPAYGEAIIKTINDLDNRQVLKEIEAGIEEEGMLSRVVRVYKTSDVSFIGKEAATLSGSGIGIGIQSKGTAIIHQKDLYPLTNLELFPQAPSITLAMYRQIGKNAARYAKGVHVQPIKTENDPKVRAKYQVKAALMHTKETQYVEKNRPTVEARIGG